MNNHHEVTSWQNTVDRYPNYAEAYAASCNQLFDAMSCLYSNKTEEGKRVLSDAELWLLNSELEAMIDSFDENLNSQVIHVQGRGMFYPEEGDTFGFLDGTQGISGHFDGMRVEELPLYHDLVYKNDTRNRQVLSISLERYAHHNADSSVGLFNDTNAIIPIVGQDICINRYFENI